MIERSIDARLVFLGCLGLSVALEVRAMFGFGLHLRWNALSFVPVAAAVVMLILAGRWLRGSGLTGPLESVSDVQQVSMLVLLVRLLPAFGSSAVGLLVAQFTGAVSALPVGVACALILYTRAWPGARTYDALRERLQVLGRPELFDEWLATCAGRPRVSWRS